MKVDIENVQCIVRSSYEFPDSGLALIYGDNSVGKSSIIRAIAAAISYDDSNRDSRISEEQKLLGILQDDTKSSLGLIRLGSDAAKIKLKGDLIDETAIITRNGRFKGSNPRFVITNVLSDVSWIIRILTRTTSEKISDYLKGFNEMIPRYDDIVDQARDMKKELLVKIQELNRMIKENAETQRKINEKKKTLEEKRQLQKALQEKINEEARKDPNREKLVLEINSQVAKMNSSIGNLSGVIERLLERKRNEGLQIDQLKNDIEQNERKLESFKKSLEEYNKNDLNDIPKIEEEIEVFKKERYKEQFLYDILERTYAMLEGEHSDKVLCPLCGSSEINSDQIKRIADEKDKAIRVLDSKISELTRKLGTLKEINKRKEFLSQQISGIEIYLKRNKDDLKQYIQNLAEIERELKEKEEQKADLIRQRDELILVISGDNTDKIKALQGEIKSLESEIKDLEINKKYSQINIFGSSYPVESLTLDIFDKGVMPALSDIESHFLELIETEKNKLREEFNKSIKGILKEMSFDLDIYVDADFNIIARKKTDNGYRILETQNLSRSEQATIALTLQLALANVYAPNYPLILCDGIYEYFDEERRDKILAFANEFGKKHNCTIIITVVKKGMDRPVVRLP